MAPKLYYPNTDELRAYTVRFHQPPVFVKEDQWFRENQAALLSLANTDYGRDLLCLDPRRKRPEPITRLTKNLCSYYLGQQNGRHYWATDGRVGAKWGNVIRSRWLEVNTALEQHRARLYLEGLLRLPPLRLVDGRVLVPVGGGITTTAYPDPDPETATVDGNVGRSVNGTFTAVRTGAGDSADPTAASLPCQFYTTAVSGEYDQFFRFISLFDFSAIADTNTKESATYELVSDSTLNNFTEPGSLSMVTTAPDSPTNLIASDYGTFGLTPTAKQATDRLISEINTGGSVYNVWTMNAAGLTSISLTTISKFGLCITFDYADTAPTWAANTNVSVGIFTAEKAGTTTDPKIVLIHSALVSGSTVLIVSD